MKILWSLQLLSRLRQFFRDHPFDVVVTFLWRPTLLAALALDQIHNPPLLIWSVQSDLTQGFRLHGEGWLARSLVRTLLPSRVDYYVAVSEGTRRKTQELLGVSEERITVIPNSIDRTQIVEVATRKNSTPPKRAGARVVSIGRLHPAKGIDVLLQALSLVNRQIDDWEYWILGEGSESQRLSDLASQLGLNGCVHFAGHTANPYAWLLTADVSVSASRWETFGVAIAEAMALGVPVVATATDGAVDIITEGVDGMLVPIGDTQALAGAIVKLLCDPALRHRLGAQAQLKARDFDAPVIAQQYLTVVERLLKERSRHG